MSNVDYETFLKWAQERFGIENVRVHGDEIKTNSIFVNDDNKFHLWMNPSGGKSKHGELGSYRCWKTHKAGSLVSLVSYVDKCSFEEAEETICNVPSLRALEAKVHKFFNSQTDEVPPAADEPVNAGIEFPPNTYKIDDMPSLSRNKRIACDYLRSRNLPSDNLYYCTDGNYRNRIVIPYFDQQGRLIYWNARSVKEGGLKYMKPDDPKLSQENVLFCRRWPRQGKKLYITEGEFDAIVLDLCELNGCGQGGKSITDAQINMLRGYIPVLAYDNDEGKKKDTGFEATIENGNKLLEAGFTEVYYVRPPKGYKDWNELYQKKGGTIVKTYIEKYEMPFNIWTGEMLKMKRV
jgi:hypothetical protein